MSFQSIEIRYKLNRHSIPIGKKYVVTGFSTYYCGAWYLKQFIRPPPKNTIFVSGCSITMVHGIWKKFNRTRPSPKEKNIFVSGYSTTMMHGTYKFLIGAWIAPKNKYFCFYYCTTMNYEIFKLSIGNQPPTNSFSIFFQLLHNGALE